MYDSLLQLACPVLSSVHDLFRPHPSSACRYRHFARAFFIP
jgi:hypothetical protein